MRGPCHMQRHRSVVTANLCTIIVQAWAYIAIRLHTNYAIWSVLERVSCKYVLQSQSQMQFQFYTLSWALEIFSFPAGARIKSTDWKSLFLSYESVIQSKPKNMTLNVFCFFFFLSLFTWFMQHARQSLMRGRKVKNCVIVKSSWHFSRMHKKVWSIFSTKLQIPLDLVIESVPHITRNSLAIFTLFAFTIHVPE